jgi:putative DNA primase/helicase
MPEQSVRDFLQRAMGYTLSGTAQEQCLLVMIGVGANGKSTFANTMAKMMGDYAGTTPMTTLTVQKYNNPAGNDLAELVGKRFVYAAEGEGSDTLAEAKVKWMTGGEPITARKLYKNFFTFTPAFTLWLATNELPRVQGTTEGIWRRFNVIEFPITIPASRRDHNLSRKLLGELPGILNFALEGYRAWKREGLNAPPQIRQATNSYRNENDTVQQFIDSCCELEISAKETTISLHSSFELWCAMSGMPTVDRVKFGKEMKRHGFESFHSSSGNGWRGLKLKDGTQAF